MMNGLSFAIFRFINFRFSTACPAGERCFISLNTQHVYARYMFMKPSLKLEIECRALVEVSSVYAYTVDSELNRLVTVMQ